MGRRIKRFTAPMELVDAASDGRAVARHEGQVIFVERGVPGDQAEVHVYGKQKKMLLGRIETLLRPSEDRIEPECTHFGSCGGCKWQMMDYSAQLCYKEKQVIDAFERIAKVEVGEKLPILGAEHPYFYRNKLEFTFSNKAWLPKELLQENEVKEIDQRVLGFHTPRIFDKIINIDTCHLQTPLVNEVRNAVRDFAREQSIAFYDIRQNTGYLRNLMFRTSESSGEMMLVLIVSEDNQELLAQIFPFVEAKFPQIPHLVWIVNPKVNSSFSELPFHVWKGKDHIIESLGDFQFKISPTSFFQTNPKQAAQLYGGVKRMAMQVLPEGEEAFDCIYDLYSGTGSIGIYLSALAKKVVGIEYVESAIADAKENVALNQLDHFSFFAGDMKKILVPELVQEMGKPDLIVADPPRAGMDPKVVAQILKIAPQHIIYVSCKPATQARDIALMQAQYEVVQIQPVDMFPQTAHVENIALLRRKEP